MHCKSNYFTFRDLIDVVDYLEGQDVYFENDVHHIYGRQCSPEELQERVQLILELNRLSDRTRLIEELPPQIVQLVFKCDTIFCLRDRADTIARHYFKTIGKHPFYIWIAEKNEVRSFYGEYFDGSVEKLSFNPESHTF